MGKRRVVITGMGAIAPNGIGVETFWNSLVHGRSGIRRITEFDASHYPCQVAGEVKDWDLPFLSTCRSIKNSKKKKGRFRK